MTMTAQPQQKYREMQISTASPLQRLLMVYDVALAGCNQRDLKRTVDALSILMSSLDMSQGEISMRLFRLYQYCSELARDGNFDEAGQILRQLVESWVEVLVHQTDAGTLSNLERSGLLLEG